MKGKLLLFVGDRQCLLARKSRGLEFLGTFPNNDAGKKEFERHLDAAKIRSVGILADLIEEDYRIERLPHLNWLDRKRYHAKKLEQYYRHTPFRNALLQEREGKEDKVLFSALTGPHLVLPWVELLAQRKIALSGICSVAMLSGRLVESIPSSHVMLLSFQNGTGLRQSFFLDGHLNFSRLTTVHPGEPLVAVVREESERIYKYLHTLNLLPEKEALLVCILCGREDRKRFEEIPDTASIHHVLIDLEEAGKRIGLSGGISGSDALPLFFHLLGPDNQYGNEQHTHVSEAMQWRHFSYLLSASMVVAGSAFAAIDFSRAVALHGRAQSVSAQAKEIMRRYGRLVPPESGTDTPQKMKEAVLLSRKISSDFPSPAKIMDEVSLALDSDPALRIDRLSWQVTKNPESPKASSGKIEFDPGLFGPGPLYDAVSIEGEIFPFDGNYRSANEAVGRLRAELEKKGMRIVKIRLPLDLSPEAALAGKSGGMEDKAQFFLQAIRKRES